MGINTVTMTSAQLVEATEMYHAGKIMKDIGALMGLSYNKVRQNLLRANVYTPYTRAVRARRKTSQQGTPVPVIPDTTTPTTGPNNDLEDTGSLPPYISGDSYSLVLAMEARVLEFDRIIKASESVVQILKDDLAKLGEENATLTNQINAMVYRTKAVSDQYHVAAARIGVPLQGADGSSGTR